MRPISFCVPPCLSTATCLVMRVMPDACRPLSDNTTHNIRFLPIVPLMFYSLHIVLPITDSVAISDLRQQYIAAARSRHVC